MTAWPEQTREIRNKATAPYNFVPLPSCVVTVVTQEEIQNCADEYDLGSLLETRLPGHDSYLPDRHSGHIVLTLETRSPLYIRGPLTPSQYEYQETIRYADGQPIPMAGTSVPDFRRMVSHLSEFFYTQDKDKPVIPGSSIHGMLRTLVEIVGYGKVRDVTDRTLFFRTVDDSSLGRYYRDRLVDDAIGFVDDGSNPKARAYGIRARAGFFRHRQDGGYEIQPCNVARVALTELVNTFGQKERSDLYELDGKRITSPVDKRNPNQTPSWLFQHKKLCFNVDPVEKDYFFRERLNQKGKVVHPNLYLRFRRARNLSRMEEATKVQGCLVLTGHTNNKKLAFLFFDEDGKDRIPVPDDLHAQSQDRRLVQRFHSDDQLTAWQRLAFPIGRPSGSNRQRDGFLRDGEPVFYLIEGGRLTFFGRAQMFRLPYRSKPVDLVPESLRRPGDIDFAESLFGFVRTAAEIEAMKLNVKARQCHRIRAYAGRVSVSDARLAPGQTDIWLSPDEPLVTHILASPKPTAFQLYLVQTNGTKNSLRHFDSPTPSETVIRGHKMYWHRGNPGLDELRAKPDSLGVDEQGSVSTGSTQHTQMSPVKAGKRFECTIHFENLSDVELGAILWALTLPGVSGDFCYKLGMAKSLGMGSIAIVDQKLHIHDVAARYNALVMAATEGSSGIEWHTPRKTVDKARCMSGFEQHVLKSINSQFSLLAEEPRIASLLSMLECRAGTPNWREKTTHGTLETQIFKDRYVLPHPLDVGGPPRTAPYAATKQAATEGQGLFAPPGHQYGTVKDFGRGTHRSYGFITPDGGGKEVFVHKSALPDGVERLNAGQRVAFRLVNVPGKGMQADDVRLPE